MQLTPKQMAVALREGYRSGLEDKVGQQIADEGLDVDYESHTVRFTQPETTKRYTPDFVLPNGIVIETKGRFVTNDRQKHRNIKAQHPDLDIRFVFSNPRQRISKTSKTTYAAWCERYGFQFAKLLIPDEWFAEAPCAVRIAAIEAFRKAA